MTFVSFQQKTAVNAYPVFPPPEKHEGMYPQKEGSFWRKEMNHLNQPSIFRGYGSFQVVWKGKLLSQSGVL